MKFEYDKETDEPRKPIAWVFEMETSFNTDDLALCITTTNPEKFLWMYSDGYVTVQSAKPEGIPLKVFYEGDSITITF